jgi:hypothetical protein
MKRLGLAVFWTAASVSAFAQEDASVFAVSEAAIPALSVTYVLPDGTEGTAESEPVPLEVASLLPRDAQEQQLADIRPPVPLDIGRAFFVAMAVLLLAVGALAWWLWRRRRPAALPAAPARPPVPPDVAARDALDRLAASGRVEREEFRPFYIELTEIAKRYLEARLGAPILEMTSAETIAFLREDPRTEGLAGVMREVAGAADQIKFARGQGAREMAQDHLGAVRQLVQRLESALRPHLPEPMPAATPPRAAHR